MVQPYSSSDTSTAWKNSHFILSERLDFYKVINLSIAFYALAMNMLISLSVNVILLPWYMK